MKAPVYAEEDHPGLIYEHLTIYVMPQYVEPETWESVGPPVLIGIHGTLANESETSYRKDIRIPAPHDATDFQFAKAGKFIDGETIEELEAIVDEGTGEIVWEPGEDIAPGETYDFVVEYYFSLTKEGHVHELPYIYSLERETETANILIFEPYNAEQFSISGEADLTTEMLGVPVHVYNFTNRDSGKIMDVTISYEKSDSVTTVEAMDEGAPPAESAATASEGSTTEIVFSIILSVIIIGLLLFFIWKSRKKSVQRKEKVDVQEKQVQELRNRLIRGEIDKETYEKLQSEHSSYEEELS